MFRILVLGMACILFMRGALELIFGWTKDTYEDLALAAILCLIAIIIAGMAMMIV